MLSISRNSPTGPIPLHLYPRGCVQCQHFHPRYERNMNTGNVVTAVNLSNLKAAGSSNVHHNVCSWVQNMAAQYWRSHFQRMLESISLPLAICSILLWSALPAYFLIISPKSCKRSGPPCKSVPCCKSVGIVLPVLQMATEQNSIIVYIKNVTYSVSQI